MRVWGYNNVAKEKLGDQRIKSFFDQILSPSIFWHFKLNKLVFGMVSTTNVEEFRNIMLSKYELARVNTIFTTIKVQLKFGYFITCNGIPVDSTSSFYIFVRRAKCLLICLYMYRISRCIGLHDTKIKLKKNHQNLNHQIILKKKKYLQFLSNFQFIQNITGCQIRRRDHIAKFNEASWIKYFVRPDDKTPVFVGCIKA